MSLSLVTWHHYPCRMARIQVQRPQSASDVAGMLAGAASIAFITLKLTGIVTWSWWWVLSPAWIGVATLALLAGGLIILWCLGRWPVILMDLYRWGRRRQPRS